MLSSALVRGVLDSLPDAMIIIDSSGKILFANHQVTELFGHANAEILGQPIELLLPDRFRQRHVGHRTGYANNVRPMGIGLELFAMRKDGSEFPVEISLSPLAQGDDRLVAAAIRDVTERKLVEQALTEARRDAERANLAKSRFLATASHDLRQPLQTLGLLNGALRRMVTDPECYEVLTQQEEATDAMSRLLNALLDISKLESGAITLALTDFPLAPLFEVLRRDFAGLAASKGLRLAVDSPIAPVHSDPALVTQLLRNLLSNAVKYTPRGLVALHCESFPGRLRIEVRDSGIGIATDQVPLIFDEFYQVGVSPNSSRDGYGLGLSIVQRIASLLELRIDVTSTPDQGSVFAFELPAATGESARGADTAKAARQPTIEKGAHRILLVEDEPGVRNAMRMLFRMEGYRVIAAATAAEALDELADDPKFDLVISDYHLEDGRRGTEVISAARARLGETLKAVLVTGDTSSAISELQADAHLRIISKPIHSESLLQLVRALLAS
ncbi:MAG: PAS domain S-box protein [Steroidobacteraceae bacterium]|nr:PAS domain S-box protein [Steroidobacteraceae bacterium]